MTFIKGKILLCELFVFSLLAEHSIIHYSVTMHNIHYHLYPAWLHWGQVAGIWLLPPAQFNVTTTLKVLLV